MTTKLISANMGIVLLVERDGEQKQFKFSVECPRGEDQPMEALYAMKRFIDEVFGYSIEHKEVPIVRPAKIKAHKPISQDEFNRRIKEIVP